MNHSLPKQPSRIIRRAAMSMLVCGVSLGTSSADAGDGGHGPVYKTLDSIAGGIETIFRLGDQGTARCDENCDDGCDHGLLQELSTPMDLNQIYLAPADPAPLRSAPLPPADIERPQARQLPQRRSGPDLPPPVQRPVERSAPLPVERPIERPIEPPAAEAIRRPRPESPKQLRRDLPQPLIRQPISTPNGQSGGKWFQDRGIEPAPAQDWFHPRGGSPATQAPKPKPPTSGGGFFDDVSDPFVDDSASMTPKSGLIWDEGVLQAVSVESLRPARSNPSPAGKRQPSSRRRANQNTVRQVSGQLELTPLKFVD